GERQAGGRSTAASFPPRWIASGAAAGRPADPSGARPGRAERLAQLALAQADRVGRHLDQLVLVDPLEAVLEAHGAVGHEAHRLVVARGAHVAELLLAADVHVEVGVARVLAHHHALVDGRAGGDEEDAALLEVEEGIRRGHTLSVGHHGAVGARRDGAVPGLVAVDGRVARPRTRKASVAPVSSTRRLTFRRLSCQSRSRSFRDVTWLPERPAHGLVFTANTIAMVGSSMRMGGSASGRSRSATVSPMWMSSMPAMATMSPAQARSSSMRFNPCQP